MSEHSAQLDVEALRQRNMEKLLQHTTIIQVGDPHNLGVHDKPSPWTSMMLDIAAALNPCRSRFNLQGSTLLR